MTDDADPDAEPRRSGLTQKYTHIWDSFEDLPPALCRKIVDKYRNLLRGAVRQFPRSLLRVGMLGEDDLEQLATIILLQSWRLFRPEMGGSFQGWALYRIRQRFSKIQRDLRLLAEHEAHLSVMLSSEVSYEIDVADFLRTRKLERAIEALPSRKRFVMESLRRGRPAEVIAEDLGISRQRVDQLRKSAMDTLREVLRHEVAEAGVDADDEVEDDEDGADQGPTSTLSACRDMPYAS